MSMSLFMRPVKQDDFDTMMTLARETGPGFTSLPEDEDLMRRKIDASLKSFAQRNDDPHQGRYLLLAECAETGEIAGCSAVKAGVGLEQPFYNYRVITLTQSSPGVNRKFNMDALILTNEFGGCTEVGSLFLREAFRGGGNGRLLAQSRYLLIASAPDLFGETILAELRGIIDGESYSPFWEALTRRFFLMDYDEADTLSATRDNQFIMDLMPKHPIYVDLMDEEARAVIGKCHPDGRGAVRMLEWEGLRYNNVIDIFDGGPLMSGPRDQIRTIKESRVFSIEVSDISEDEGELCLLARMDLGNFRSTFANGILDDDTIILSAATLERLALISGDSVRVWCSDTAKSGY